MSHDQQHQHDKGGAPELLDFDQGLDVAKAAWPVITEYAKSGKGSQKDLPARVAEVAGLMGPHVIKLMPDIAKHANGDVVLECGRILGMPLGDRVELALHAGTKVKAESLRAHLQAETGESLATLDDKTGLIDELRKLFKGPLGTELPELENLPQAVYGKSGIIKWYVETTDPTVAALVLSSSADAKLVATLDAVASITPKAWGWLDHLHISPSYSFGVGLASMRDLTANTTAKPKLEKLAASFIDDNAARVKDQDSAKPELAKQVSGTDDAAFLTAAARTQGAQDVDRTGVAHRLKGASADVVLEYASTLSLFDAKQIGEVIELLHHAVGTTKQHVHRILEASAMSAVAGALATDKWRKYVRQMIGTATPLRELFTHSHAEELHPFVVRDEALRQWAYESAHPRDWLWIAAGSAEGAKEGARHVQADKGTKWIYGLPHDADRVDLRRFILYCKDEDAIAWMERELLHDHKSALPANDSDVELVDSATFGVGAQPRLDLATTTKPEDADPQVILARLADLDATERAKLLDSKQKLASVFADLAGNELRAVQILCPTLGQLMKFPIKSSPQLIDYFATRPSDEELVAAQHAKTAHAMLGDVSPFLALPSLRQPDVLAKALADNGDLLDWIIGSTEPNQALGTLARDPARKVAAGLMESRASVYDGLPAYETLRKSGRQSFDAVTKDIKDDDSKREVDDYKSGDAVIDQRTNDRAKDFKQAAKKDDLAEALTQLLDQSAPREDLIALVQGAPATQQVALLSGAHDKVVSRLRSRTHLGPQHVFPDLSTAQLLAFPSTAEWLLVAQGQPTVALQLASGSAGAIKAMAKTLSDSPELADGLVEGLPRGAGLTATERHTIDEVGRLVTDPKVARLLFSVRFDVAMGAFDLAETRRIWSLLQRLPPAQVNQHVIREFQETSLEGPSGRWSDDGGKLNQGVIEIEQDPTHREETDTYGRGIEMTAEEVKQAYELDDAGLKKASGNGGWLIPKSDGKFVVKPLQPKSFDSTVLHEVGHSVDTLLGEHTDLIYEIAGWKRFGYDQFEQWANDMGALENLKGDDRKRFVEAWQQSLRSGTAVNKLVSSDHPAITAKTPLAPFADLDAPFLWTEKATQPAANGKVFLQTPGALASVKKQTWDAAPTDYSMTSPMEYFAECYVEYYCRYDGTPTTESLKGGRLPAWLKKWFDTNVDKIRFNPQHVRGED